MRTRLGLCLVILVLVTAVTGGVLWTALVEAERGLVAALEGKAKAHARIVRGDVELALQLGIPLAALPGAYEYLEGGAEADPDIRFVATTDPELLRLHYGGIGRARLDPLLDTEPVRAVAASVASHPEQPLRAVAVEGFSITPAPLFENGRHAGFVVVAVQGILATVLVVTLAAGWLHVRSAGDVAATAWLFSRGLAGLAAGGLLAVTLLLEDRLAILPWLQLGLLGLAMLASNRAPVVRRQLFAAGGGRAEGRG